MLYFGDEKMKRYAQNDQVNELIKCIKFGIQCAAMYFIRRNMVNPIVNSVIKPIPMTKKRKSKTNRKPSTME